MNTALRGEVQDYLRVCETLLELADQQMLTIEECEAVASCSRELEKKVIPPSPDDAPAADTLSNFPPIE